MPLRGDAQRAAIRRMIGVFRTNTTEPPRRPGQASSSWVARWAIVGQPEAMSTGSVAISENDLERVAHDGARVVLARDGQALAAVVSLADLAFLRKIEDEEDLAAAIASEADPGPNLTLDEVFAERDGA